MMNNKTDDFEEAPPVEIPSEMLSEDVVLSLIEEFVLREGTDYGASEVSFDKKKEQVLKQLEKKEIKIVFDPNTETVTLMTLHQFVKATSIAAM